MKLADHAGAVLARLAVDDARIFVLDGDLADSDGAIHFAERHPGRFLMAGIAEQGMISTAAGMAAVGARPCVFSFSAFLCYRGYDQIRVCLSQAEQPVILVGSHAGGLSGRNGKTHAAPNDLALMLSLPGIRVWAPADFADVEFALEQSMRNPMPTYIRLPRKQFALGENLRGNAAAIRWIRPKRPLTIVSTGLATRWAEAVAERLSETGMDVGVLHCLELAPQSGLGRQLEGVQQLISLEDHCCFGGLGALLAQHCPGVPLRCFGWPANFVGKSGADEEVLEYYGLSTQKLAQRIALASTAVDRA